MLDRLGVGAEDRGVWPKCGPLVGGIGVPLPSRAAGSGKSEWFARSRRLGRLIVQPAASRSRVRRPGSARLRRDRRAATMPTTATSDCDARRRRMSRRRLVAVVLGPSGVERCLRRLDTRFVSHAAGECSSRLFAPGLRQSPVRRPLYRLSTRWSSSRSSRVSSSAPPASSSPCVRRWRAQSAYEDVIELERALAGAEAELAAERAVVDDRLAAAIKSLSADALDTNSARFLELADARLAGYVRPLKDSLERMDRQLQGVERIRQEAYGALRSPGERPVGPDGQPRERASGPPRSRALGRGAAAQRRRAGRDGRALRLRATGDRVTTTSERCDRTSSSGSQAGSTSSSMRRRRSLHISMRSRRQTTPSEHGTSPTMRARFETTSRSSPRSSTGGSSSRRPTSWSCSSRMSHSYRQPMSTTALCVEDAWRANVILASPSTLVVMLRTVAATWQQETVAESAREVHALGRELYERIGKVGDHLAKLGRSLNGTVVAYNEAVGSIETPRAGHRAQARGARHRGRSRDARSG